MRSACRLSFCRLAQIKSAYGFVDGFVAPSEDHPVSKGLPAGAITDDTEQALLLGRILLESGKSFDHKRWVDALIDWEREVKARGSYDLLGPSTKRAIDAINAGLPPEEAGREGDTNGAAMRVAPVGIMLPPEPLDALVGQGGGDLPRDAQHLHRHRRHRHRGGRGEPRNRRLRLARGFPARGRCRRVRRETWALDCRPRCRGPHRLGLRPGARQAGRRSDWLSLSTSSAPASPASSRCQRPSRFSRWPRAIRGKRL